MATNKVFLVRSEQLSASHRLNSPLLSPEENLEVFQKCNGTHGHNYNVEVTLYGSIDIRTGMVYNLSDLKTDMNKAIMDIADHKNLDDLEYFKTRPSTTENLCLFFYENLKKVMSKPELLYEVRIHETAKNTVYYRGE